MAKTITLFPVSWYSAFLQSELIADYAEQSKLETVKMKVVGGLLFLTHPV